MLYWRRCARDETRSNLALEVLLLLFALLGILFAAQLFTNAVEWVGVRLGMGHGAVGSVLAAIGTAMPETMIPIIAIIFVGSADAEEVGVGAILGAPFLLSTAAFSVTGVGLLVYAGQRRHGREMRFASHFITRDFLHFFAAYLAGIGSSFLPYHEMKIGVGVVLLVFYGSYVYRAVSNSGDEGSEEDMEPLRLHRLIAGAGSPPSLLVAVQFLFSLGVIIAAAYLFVEQMDKVAHDLSVPALALALIVAPLASELPETFNSVIWLRQGKDTLAMGNISGAMVFQSCIPVSVGLIFTDWELTGTALISAAVALASTAVVFASIQRQGFATGPLLARAGLLWVGFVIYVVVKVAVE
jgi:cation:H+ antiporter